MRVKAKVILSRCKDKKHLFGMRVQEHNGDWVRTWAFPIQEETALQEGFDKVQIQGKLNVTDEYPGCPFCGSKEFFVCGKCKKINCYYGEEITTCRWCGSSADTKGADNFDVTGGGY